MGGTIQRFAIRFNPRKRFLKTLPDNKDQQSNFADAPPSRVLVAADRPISRAGIRSILDNSPQIEVVGEAGKDTDAVRLVRSLHPDVLLILGGSGAHVAYRLQKTGLSTRVLVLSSNKSSEYAAWLMQCGAHGYLTKGEDPALLVEAVRAVARGEVRWFVQPDPNGSASNVPATIDELTERELEVLCLLARGQSNRGLAETLSVSENTIRTHTSRIYRKLGVRSAREAIAWAWQSGFMSTDQD